jgi:predicted DCC family thiol-disulfide oxidoreductase YuxK
VSDSSTDREILFYDGTCALCHRAVKFVLRHDREGQLFHFAPLGGERFLGKIPPEQRAGLPDSVVLRTKDGRLLVRSDAFLYICKRIGGGWKILAGALRLIPKPVRDHGYDLVARVRYRIFGRTEDWCPLIPAELRRRFEP